MVKHFSSLACLGVLALGCASKSNGVDSTDSAGGACAFGCAMGGAGYGGNAGNAGSGNTGATNLLGGMTKVTDASSLVSIEDAACTGSGSELEVNPALLEFVVDVSWSMVDPKFIYNGQTKWQVTQAALSNAILNVLPDNTGVGILFFPDEATVANRNTTAIDITNCVKTSAAIPVAPLGPAGSAQRSAIATGLSGATVAGGTPTEDAYDYAYRNGVLTAMATYGYFTPFMVLITDGQPTIALGCEGTGGECYPTPSAPIVADIATAFANTPPVKTFVIGSPGSDEQSCTGDDGRPGLSQMARAGGTPFTPDCNDSGPNYCHFDMTQSTDFAADLATVLTEIIKSAIPCNFTIPAPTSGGVPDPTKVNVFYEANVQNGTPEQQYLVLQTSDPSCPVSDSNPNGDGWYFDPTSGALVLCPATCKTVQSDKYAKLEIYQGCSTCTGVGCLH